MEKQRFVDPLADCAAALADARCPPTPLGARADLERLHEYRAQRRAAGRGPQVPLGPLGRAEDSGVLFVRQLLRSFVP